MTGFASPIFHRINASMLSLFSFVLPFFCLAMGMLKQGQHQCRAAGRFATEYLVQFIRLVPIRLVPSTVCLAMGLLFFSAAGAMAWEPGPDNYIPVADAGPDRVVRPGAKVKLDGRNSITRRSGGLNYSWARTGGTPGASVALKRANRKRPKFVADRLVAGDDDVIHIFTLTVRDTSGTAATDTVTITVDAPEIRNFPPVANAGQDQRVASGVVVQLDGRNSSDNEGEIASWSWRRTGGTFGKSVVMTNANTARPRFIADILPAGAGDVFHLFTLTVTDHDGAVDTDWVWVRVNAPEAPNLPPVANAGPDQVVVSGDTVTLNASRSSDREGPVSYFWEYSGGTGNGVSMKGTETWSIITFNTMILPPGAADITYNFTLTVTDNQGLTDTDTVTITATAPPFPAPVANAGPDLRVESGDRVTLDGTDSSGGNRSLNYAWARTGGTRGGTVALNGANTALTTFTADILTPGAEDVIHVFTLTVTDVVGASHADTVTITVEAPEVPNLPPVANAGQDQIVVSGTTVQLDGSNSSDTDGTIASWSWARTGGTRGGTVTMTGANTARPTFIADTLSPGTRNITHVFTLRVTDSAGGIDTDTVTVTVTVDAPNLPPVANAGPDQSVASGDTVTLNGSGSSDTDGTIASWSWARTGGTRGSTVTMTGANTARPTFIADTLSPGARNITHVFTLRVTDSAGGIDTDTVTVTVTVDATNLPPVANAGPDQSVASGDTVTLNGSGSSDTDGTIASWSWRRTGGTFGKSVVMTNANTARPRFIADILPAGAGDVFHLFTLTVTDHDGAVDTDWVWVRVNAPEAPNLPPVANAGPDQVVVSGDTVTLNASRSSDREGPVSYFWEYSGGTGNGVSMKGTETWSIITFNTMILPPGAADITYNFTLTVTDNQGLTDTDTVTITATAPPFPAPVANAGPDLRVESGDRVTLDGTDSSGGNRSLNYAWARTGGTRGGSVALNGANTALTTFTADILTPGAEDVIHVFTLTVTDVVGASHADTVTITVEAPEVPNLPPVANAGQDQIVVSGTTVQLDGSNSSDTDGTIASWSWARTGGTRGGTVTMTGANTARPTFIADTLSPGARNITHVFTLRVTDSAGATDTDTVTVTVESPFAPTVAHAGNDQEVLSGTTVILDGSGSTTDYRSTGTTTNPHGVLKYAWARTGGTTGGSVTLNNASAERPVFTADSLDAGSDNVIHVFTLTVTDEVGGTDTDTVTITVTAPSFVIPVANAGPDRTVAAGMEVILDGTGSTVDHHGTIMSYAWKRTGGTSVDTVFLTGANTISPVFTADALDAEAADVTHVFELTVTNNVGNFDTDTVTITIEAPEYHNPRPVSNAGPDQVVASGATVQLDGSGSSGGVGSLAYTWNHYSSVVLNNPNTAYPSFTAPTLPIDTINDMIYVFHLAVTDDLGQKSRYDTVLIQVKAPGNPNWPTAPNLPPVANAGPDQVVASGATVQLDGSGSSDTDSAGALQYVWGARTSGIKGNSIVLSPAFFLVRPSFEAEVLAPGAADVIHTFTLTVTDSHGAVDSDMMTVTIVAPFAAPPVADAGLDQVVDSGEIVSLDGSRSTTGHRSIGTITGPDNILNYAWTRTGGTSGASVLLNDASTALPSFIADTLVPDADNIIHVFTLTVTNEAGETDTDIVKITVIAPIAEPVANAGDDQLVSPGAEVTLDGNDSTVDSSRTIRSWSWTRTGGTGVYTVALTNANTATPTFTANSLAPGTKNITHVFTLSMTDSAGATDTDTVTITVESPFAPTVAHAGNDQEVLSGTTVILDGSGSTTDYRSTGTTTNPHGVLKYAWARTGGTTGGSVTLNNASAERPVFTADSLDAGSDNVIHVFTLTVTDEVGGTDTDTVTITVTAPSFVIPVANAGPDRTVAAGMEVILDGTGSTVDHHGTIMSYAWKRTGGTSVDTVFLTGANTISPVFTADALDAESADVTHVFELTVTNNVGNFDTDTVTITVNAPEYHNPLPIPNAGPNQVVASGATVQLDGSGSSGGVGSLAYTWNHYSSVVLNNPNTAYPSFTAPTLPPGSDMLYTFHMTVTDDLGQINDYDTVMIQVKAPGNPNWYTHPNLPPVANAGPDQVVASGATVQLDGSGSSDDWDSLEHGLSLDWGARTSGIIGNSIVLSPRFSVVRPSFEAEVLAPGAADVTHTFILTVTDQHGAVDSDMMTVTIVAPFAAPPVANAGLDQVVDSGEIVSLDGSRSTTGHRSIGTITGPDNILNYAWTRTGGTSGASVLLNDASTALPSFTADTLVPDADNIIHVFTLTVTNEAGETDTDIVKITVIAPIAEPVANAGDDQLVSSGAEVTLDGNDSTVDSSRTIRSWSWTRTGGTGVHTVALTNANTATPTFTANSLAPGTKNITHVFTLSVRDSGGETDTDTVTITVESPFAPTVAHAGNDQEVLSGTTVILDGSGSTTDYRNTGTTTNPHGVLKYAWARTGGTTGGSVTLNNANAERPVFTADSLDAGSDDVIHIFTLTVTDKVGGRDTDTVTVTVESPNQPPVANAGPDLVVAPGEIFTLDGSGSTDSDGSIVSYRWWQVTYVSSSDSSELLSLGNTPTINLTAKTIEPVPYHKTYETYLLQVADDDGVWSDIDPVRVTVIEPFEVPIANAGPDQVVASGATVTLDGSGSTHDHRRSVSYSWEQTDESGGSVSLTGASTATPGFTANTLAPGANDVVHIFTLTVTDEAGETDTDTVTVTVESPNQLPVANAGPDLVVAPGETFTLDGSGSTDSDGSIAGYYWWHYTYISSSDNWKFRYLGFSRTPTWNLTAETPESNPADKTYYHLRVVDDDGDLSRFDAVRVTVIEPFEVPIANAGPDQVVASGATVTLDGSGSTHDHRKSVSYNWEQTDESGGSVSLTGASTATPGFTANTLAPGANDVVHVFTLTVTDETGETGTDTVTITVVAPFAAPVANAGDDRSVLSGAEVTLDGSGSIHDHRRSVSYSWEQTDGSGSLVLLTGANTATPGFTANTLAPGANNETYVFTLTVTDNAGVANTDTVRVTVFSPFEDPVANAGPDQTVISGASVSLNGEGSTFDRRSTLHSYNWEQMDGTVSPVTLINANTANPTFIADTLTPGAPDVTHIFILTIKDSTYNTSTDMVTITVQTPFAFPVANAGPDQEVDSGVIVSLDGSRSTTGHRSIGTTTDSDNILNYAWTRTGGTGDASVLLSNASTALPSFTADTLFPGADDVIHIFTLTVTNETGHSNTDTMTVTVQSPFVAPIADAGPDLTVASGAMVHLGGSGSTDRDGIITYSWARTGGTSSGASVVLNDASIALPSFIADTLFPGADDVIHIFTLTVTNEAGHSDTDTMTVTVQSPFVAPVANAGPDQTVFPGTVVSLDGSGSTADFRARPNYAWTRTGGTVNVGVKLSDANTIQTDFTVAPLENGMKHATHVFTLTVTDNETGEISTDTVTITVESPLVANAGTDQLVLNGDIVVLDSSGSADRNGTIESFAWNRIGGTSTHVPSFSVFDPGALIFKAEPLTGGDADVTHIFELTVTNNTGQTDTDTVTITVTSGFGAPVANAGDDQVVHSGEIVYLDASGSLGLNDDLMTYAWTNINETEDSIILTGADTAQPSFKANTLAAGSPDVTHVFSLTVTNGASVESEAETMTVTVMAPDVTEDVSETAQQAAAATKVDILVSAPEMTVQEGESAAYRVKLGQSPGQKVMVEAFSAHKDITLEQQSFAFTAENWNEWRDVKVNTVADFDTENDRAKIEHRFVTKGMTSGQSGTITVTLREIDPILSPVGNYLASRATALLNNQPGLSDFLKRDETASDENNEFALHATNDRLTMNGEFIRNGTWGEITGSYTNSETGDTKSVLASFGVHRKLSENLLAGAMLQFDLGDHELPDQTGAIDGTGWLVGPYFTARHNSHPLHFEGRLLYGQSSNDIRFIDRNLGTRTGSFDTTRMLAQLRMEGEIALTDRENGSQLLPYVDAGWVEEKAAAFTDTTGNRVPGQKVSTGQLELGSNLRMPVAMNHGAMTLTGGLGVIWSNTKGQHITSDTQGRGRGEIGFSYDLNENVQIDFESFYDGIGTSDYESYGLSLRAEMKF